jgi:hypothetical protein
MAQRMKGRKTYRTAQGKQIDMDMLRKKNELTPAVGNARVNARGDELGPGGKIVRKHEDVVKDYYAENSGRVLDEEPGTQPQGAVDQEPVTMDKTTESKPVTRAEQEAEEQATEWVEDDEGNFVPKGE